MKENRDLSPGGVVGVLVGSCLFVITFWVLVALAVTAAK